MQQLLVCPRCGTQNPSNQKFCGTCGSMLFTEKQQAYDQRQRYKCSQCGQEVIQSMKFCATCGKPLNWPTQQQVQSSPFYQQVQQPGGWAGQPKEMQRGAMFNLRTAKSLIDEIADETEDVIALQKLAHQEERFWQGLALNWKAGGEIARLKKDLSTAINLATEVGRTSPSIQLEDGTSPAEVVAQAHYQSGLIEFRLGNWEQALRDFGNSYAVLPTQTAMFNIALCHLSQQKRTSFTLNPFEVLKRADDRDKAAKQKGVSFLGRMAEATRAGVDGFVYKGGYSTEEVIAYFNRVIDMDPNSELAIQSGKIIARLKR
jgi:tetratricopeptide (TPR) repeat protein